MEAMYCARYAYAAAMLGGFLYVAGGTGSHHTILNTVECYDPKTDDWSQVSSMNTTRRDFALVESNGFLYAMGNNEILERYDPRQDLWTVVSSVTDILPIDKVTLIETFPYFQIASFDNNENIRAAIDLYGEIYVLIQNGQFGKVKAENMSSVVPICTSPTKDFTHSILFIR